MTFGLLIGLMLLGRGGPDEARELVARLASAKSAERNSATDRLEALGEAALGALGEAAESGDLELRARAAALMDRIEGRRLGRPSLVKLDLAEATMAEAVAELSRQTGLSIGLEPEGDARWRAKRVTIREDEPVPLWDALDRIGKAGDARVYQGGSPWQRRQRMMIQANPGRGRPAKLADLVLRPSDPSPIPPTFNSGAFRVTMLGLKLHQTRTFSRTPETLGQPESRSAFTAQFQVRAEPRLVLAAIDEPKILDARDDRGQSLVSSIAAPVVERPNRGFGDELPGGGPINVALLYPESPGKTIARISGTIRALVVGRRGPPTSIPLAGSEGKAFPIGEATLTLHEARPGANPREIVVQFSVTGPNSAGGYLPTQGMFDPRSGLRPPPSARGQVEFYDDRGRLCQVFDLGQNALGYTAGSRTTLTVQPPEGVGRPVEARYYAATWASVEVPFEFRDVPMP